MIENNSGIKDCAFTIWDCANAIKIECMQKNISPDYCEEKIKIMEHDIICLKNRLGLE